MSEKLRTVIIDDEIYWREALSDFLRNACAQDIDLVATADSLESGIAAIEEHQPELLFLDIILYDKTGFSVLEAANYTPPAVVFITGFGIDYAVEAIRHEACDYLEKPIDLKALKMCIKTAKKRVPQFQEMPDLDIDAIPLPHSRDKGFEVLPYDDVILIEADKGILHFHLTGGQKRKTVAYQLQQLEQKLPPKMFLRVHNSFIVNLKHLRNYKPKGKMADLEMSNGQTVPVSASHHKKLRARFPGWFG